MKIPSLDYANGIKNFVKSGQFFLDAMRDPGFVFVKNIPGFDQKALEKQTHWFFKTLSHEQRMKVRTNPYRGFVPANPDAESSYKELYEIGGLDEDRTKEFLVMDATPWPEGGEEFHTFMRQYYSLMTEVGANLIRMLATARGQEDPHKWVEHFVPNDFSTLRLIHYPERKGETPEALKDKGRLLHCQPHSDSSFLTLLSTFHQEGLEMFNKEDGSWVAVESEEEGLFVNIGDLMVHFCGGGVVSTQHRVVDHGRERFSVPFFLEPRWDVEVDVGKYGKKQYGVWCVEKTTMFFEHKHLLDLLKKDPRYANAQPLTVKENLEELVSKA
jgi:isopenicillin N synthase-like dioxygenase